MELVMIIKLSVIAVTVPIILPLKYSFGSWTIMEMALERVGSGLLHSLTLKNIVWKSSAIMQIFWPILSVFAMCFVVMESPIVIWAICENVGTDTLGSAIIEVAYVVGFIFFEHPSESMRF